MNLGKTVLITGASTGIGFELARQFALDKYNLVLVARNRQKLDEAAEEFMNRYGCLVTIIQKDLSLRGSATELYNEVTAAGIEIDVLVNNAGVGNCGLFHETDLHKDIEMIELNIAALTVLTKLFSLNMARRGRGRILNVASTGAYQPGPFIAVYYATKAYVLSFSEAISNELKNFGVSVSTLCPGATLSEFAKRAGKADAKNAMSAKHVAKIAYKGLMNNKRIIIPGLANKAGVLIAKFLPRKVSTSWMGKMQQKLLK